MSLCTSCSNNCELPTDKNPNPKNLAVNRNGNIFCIPCADVHDSFFDDPKPVVRPIITKPIPQQMTDKKASASTYITCKNCKVMFTGPKCNCGFKNPLYRIK